MNQDHRDAIFVTEFGRVSSDVCDNAIAHGFWDGTPNLPEKIALMHSELSETLEAMRHGDPPDSHIPEFSGQEAELADCVIRIMDYAHRLGLRVGEAIIAKNAYNKARPYKHGKAF